LKPSVVQARAIEGLRACSATFRAKVGRPPSGEEKTAAFARRACGQFEQAAGFMRNDLHDVRGYNLFNRGLAAMTSFVQSVR
jgi:hypothetical protein